MNNKWKKYLCNLNDLVNWSLMMMMKRRMSHKKDNLMKSIGVQSVVEMMMKRRKRKMTYKKDNLMISIGV